jgi:hypothetical protein
MLCKSDDSSSSNKRLITTGSARNSVVFTQAAPVFSFATPGAIGLYHSIEDGEKSPHPSILNKKGSDFDL